MQAMSKTHVGRTLDNELIEQLRRPAVAAAGGAAGFPLRFVLRLAENCILHASYETVYYPISLETLAPLPIL